MAEPKERISLAEAKEASNSLSVFNNVAAYPIRMIKKHSSRNVSEAASNPPKAVKHKVRSDSLMNDTQQRQSAEGVSEDTVTNTSIQSSSAHRYAQPTYGPSCYFRCTFFNFNPNTVDINKIGILYEHGKSYFITVELPHPHTSVPTVQCGFVDRHVTGPYLFAEWHSLEKEYIGDKGITVCADDGRWAVHSHMLQLLRFHCGREAKTIDYMLVMLSEEEAKAKLSQRLKLIVEDVYMALKAKEHQAAKEADKFMEEFMVFEE
jgi:hypothetical protein